MSRDSRGIWRVMRATFFVPAQADAADDAAVYRRRIVAGLIDAGHAVQTRALPGCLAPADATATQAAHDALAALPTQTVPVIDGQTLPAFAEHMETLTARKAVALIHRPMPPHAAPHMPAGFARIIATSAATAGSLTNDFGVETGRMSVVVPGTDDAPRAIGSGGAGCHILSIGALVPCNGHSLLLRALARLFDLDWRLTVVGDATRDRPHAETLAALAETGGIAARVRFAGVPDDAALAALWHSADLFALASSRQDHDTTIADALKRGVPVAIVREAAIQGGPIQGGAADALVTPACGVICPPDDRDQLSKALRRLIFSATLRRDMAEAAWSVGCTLPDWPTQVGAFAAALDFALRS